MIGYLQTLKNKRIFIDAIKKDVTDFKDIKMFEHCLIYAAMI